MVGRIGYRWSHLDAIADGNDSLSLCFFFITSRERVDTGRTESGILSSYGTCSASGTISTIMLALIAATNCIALLYANVMAFQTRELTVAFNESKFVALAMASILQALLIGVPLLFLADSNTTARYVVRSVLIFVICMSVQVFIFLPKILHGDKAMAPVSLSVSQVRNSAFPSGASGSFRGKSSLDQDSTNFVSGEMRQSSNPNSNSYNPSVSIPFEGYPSDGPDIVLAIPDEQAPEEGPEVKDGP